MIEFDELSNKIIGLAIEVHKELGPGLLENTYKHCLAYEFSNSNVKYQLETEIPVTYKGTHVPCGYRADLIVENELIIELKSVEKLLPVHSAQLLTYMKLGNRKTGLLINFNVTLLKNGIKRFVL